MFESLESRRMLASGITVSIDANRVLTVRTGSADNFAAVIETNGSVQVDNVHAGTSQTFTAITGVRMVGQADHDDLYYTGNSLGATIGGGGGNDSIVVADTGTGSSYADGEGGDDSITLLIAHQTTLIGNGGNDQLYINTGYTGASEVAMASAESWCYGLGGGDLFTTYNGINHLFGGGGSDTLIDLGGTNYINSVETVYTV